MIEQILAFVTSAVVQTISFFGYFGVGFLMAVQTMAIPIPSEIVMPFAGSLVPSGKFNFWLLCLTASVGSVVGGSMAYFIGQKGGRSLVEKYGKIILLSKNDLNLADRFFARYGAWAVFLGMTLPIFRSFIAFPAGIAGLSLKKFVSAVFLGSLIWTSLLAYFGMKLGENWQTLREKFHGFDTAILLLIIAGGCFWVYRHFKQGKESSEDVLPVDQKS